jgi:Flp pilus assembly pilin Flp
MRVVNWLRRLVGHDSGQDLLEYAVLVALIALVAIAAIDETGETVTAIFTNIAKVLVNAA